MATVSGPARNESADRGLPAQLAGLADLRPLGLMAAASVNGRRDSRPNRVLGPSQSTWYGSLSVSGAAIPVKRGPPLKEASGAEAAAGNVGRGGLAIQAEERVGDDGCWC